MLGNILPPYHSMQELNLDWILTKVKNILRFVPDDGAVGQILRRTAHGAEWSDEQAAGVSSVNGQTGDVTLSIPDSTSDLVNDSGFVDAAGAAAAAPVQSVNWQTGAVSLSIPDSTSDLVNDSGFVDAAGAAAAAPVQSVNGQTGAVSLSIPDSTSDLVNDSGFVDAAGAAAAAPVQSVNGQTGAVTITIPDDITTAGTYNLGDIIAPGYVTGSGNYFNFWLPLKITAGLSVTSASVSGGAFYAVGGPITSGNFGSPLLSSYTKTLYGSRFEFRFASTQTANRPGNLAITDLTIVVA